MSGWRLYNPNNAFGDSDVDRKTTKMLLYGPHNAIAARHALAVNLL